MGAISFERLWPYDETTVAGDCSSGSFKISTPWTSLRVSIHSEDREKAARIVEKLSQSQVTPQDIPEVTWLFSEVSGKIPLCYILPRSLFPEELAALDSHVLTSDPSKAGMMDIRELLRDSAKNKSLASEVLTRFPNSFLEWKWDEQTALLFSQLPSVESANPSSNPLFDPYTLFSVARRFHLLDSIENSQVQNLYQWVRGLPKETEIYRQSCIKIVRQNHYVTQRCESVLRPALDLAQNAREDVLAFIKAEAGHDVLLRRSLKSLSVDRPNEIPPVAPIELLMDLFEYAARNNFLAFAMIVDIFERTSHDGQDPLAQVLTDGGFEQAAKQIDIHREINDSGEHENVALDFLSKMGPVHADYATEALRINELASTLMNLMVVDVFEAAKKECSSSRDL